MVQRRQNSVLLLDRYHRLHQGRLQYRWVRHQQGRGGFGGLLLGLFFGGVGFFYFVVQFSISLLFNFQKNSRGGGGGVMRYCIDFAFFIVTILLVGVFHVCKNTYNEPQ